MEFLKMFLLSFWKDEEGLETLEILLILAVLVGIALLFGKKLIAWVKDIIDNIDPTPPKAE